MYRNVNVKQYIKLHHTEIEDLNPYAIGLVGGLKFTGNGLMAC
jgi:hypothetical protein